MSHHLLFFVDEKKDILGSFFVLKNVNIFYFMNEYVTIKLYF